MQPHQRAQRHALAGAGFAEQRQHSRPSRAARSTPATARTGLGRRCEIDGEAASDVDDRRVAGHAVARLRPLPAPRMTGGRVGQVAGGEMPPPTSRAAARLRAAHAATQLAAGVEAAAGRRIDRVRRIAGERRLLRCGCPGPSTASRRAAPRCRDGAGCAEDRLGGADLGDLAEIHHHHAVRHEAHDVEIVRDEDVGQAELVLEVEQQVEHLGLDRLVERRHRLVEDQQPRLERERARDVDALALAAGNLVRIAAGEARRLETDAMQQIVRARDRRLARQRRARAGRTRWCPRRSGAD